MAISDTLQPATTLFGGVFGRLAQYYWVLFIVLGIVIAIGIVFYVKYIKDKKAQWTHTLEVKRVMPGGVLSEAIVHKMRRFPLIKNAEVFELEKPLLGSYLIPEPGKYSGSNKYSIILDDDNRVWRNEGEFFNATTGSVNVSARHAEIDLQIQTLKADFQNINKVNKRLDWMKLAQYTMISIIIIAIAIVAIVGIGEWGEAQKGKAEREIAQTNALIKFTEALKLTEESKNTDLLIIDKLNQLYGTRNIQGAINDVKN